MMRERLRAILSESDPTAVKFFFGLVTIGYSIFIPQAIGHYMYRLAFEWINPWVWVVALMVNGIALVMGALYDRPTRLSFILEGVLGGAAWGALGVATAASQGVPGPTFFAMFIAIWIGGRHKPWK